jgi:hypothetical protein
MTTRLRALANLLRQSCLPVARAAICIGLAFTAFVSQTAAQESRAAKEETAWAFRKPVRATIPPVQHREWMRNPIDAFVLAKLEAARLTPAPEADRRVLIRRVTFDLLGIPPTLEEIDAFVQDARPDGYERLVDRLLNSPQFGERTASFWLDLVRYAETDGFKADDPRPNAWRYRDYVIDAANRDKSYARFVQEQVAGDELFPREREALIATGFLRHYPDEYNAVALELRRQEILNDITDVCSATFLGLTMGCARCHDHKFDPILQTDYYRLQAFFAAYQPADLALASADQERRRDEAVHEWQAKTTALREQLAGLEKESRAKAFSKKMSRFPKEYQEAYLIPAGQRSPLQTQIAYMVGRQVTVPRDEMVKAMKPEIRARWEALNKQMNAFASLRPETFPSALGMTEIGMAAPATYLLKRGEVKARGAEVAPGFPSAIDDREAPLPDQPVSAKTTGRRSVLAAWLTSSDNPLTARVQVNRLWQQHFGRGIVGTPNDFGVQGDPPSHPELLDWLSVQFMEQGWSLKSLTRLMVTSATYRQSSAENQKARAVDPQNLLLWQARRRRLEGEALRDAMLAVSGRLDDRMAGPSVHPPLPAETPATKSWPADADPHAADRRSVYIYVKRNLRYPLFHIFDVPDSNETCARRHVSTNAPQALALLNSQMVRDMARSLARRISQQTGKNVDLAIDLAVKLALGRAPEAEEKRALTEFLMQSGTATDRQTALEDVCHVLLNVNEFLYLD